MIRVVVDTNVFISALMFGGLPGVLLDLLLLKSFVVVLSPALLDELDEKLKEKFGVSAEDAFAIREKLESVAYKALHIWLNQTPFCVLSMMTLTMTGCWNVLLMEKQTTS